MCGGVGSIVSEAEALQPIISYSARNPSHMRLHQPRVTSMLHCAARYPKNNLNSISSLFNTCFRKNQLRSCLKAALSS
jgi:hypothetical protein